MNWAQQTNRARLPGEMLAGIYRVAQLGLP
jgi:hypothetical protein